MHPALGCYKKICFVLRSFFPREVVGSKPWVHLLNEYLYFLTNERTRLDLNRHGRWNHFFVDAHREIFPASLVYG